MFSIPLPDVPLPAGGGAKIARIPHRPVRAAFSDSLRSHSGGLSCFGSPGPFRKPFPTAPARIWPPFSTAPARIWPPFPTASAPFRQPQLFWQPPARFGSRLDRFVSRRTAFGSRWQALAGSARRNNPQDNTSKSAPSRCAAPIGAQRQSARRPCPWRPAGRRGSCRRPWRRRAGRHRRPASNGPLRGPRHRH